MAVQQRNIQAWFGEHWLRGVPERFRAKFSAKLQAIRQAAETILGHCPASPEQSRSITRLRDQLDEVLLEVWVSALPANAPWADVYFGEHWLNGFREEDKDSARTILCACRDAAIAMDNSDIGNIRAAWQAAMRALRCFA